MGVSVLILEVTQVHGRGVERDDRAVEESVRLTSGSKSILYGVGYVLGVLMIIITSYAILLGIWVSFVMATKWALS